MNKSLKNISLRGHLLQKECFLSGIAQITSDFGQLFVISWGGGGSELNLDFDDNKFRFEDITYSQNPHPHPPSFKAQTLSPNATHYRSINTS